MFKKLFISLIIMSALSYDAAAFSVLLLTAGLNNEFINTAELLRKVELANAIDLYDAEELNNTSDLNFTADSAVISAPAGRFSLRDMEEYREYLVLPCIIDNTVNEIVSSIPYSGQTLQESCLITFCSDPSPPLS